MPERDYMWTIISTVNPEATSKLIKDARKSRKSEDTIDQDELVEVDPALFNEIKKIVAQKGNRGYFKVFDFYTNIVHRGNNPYLLKKSAKLHRSRKPIKNYDANYGQFSSGQSEGSRGSRRETERSHRQYSTPTIEMENEKEEGKENPNTQRSFISRYDQSSNN